MGRRCAAGVSPFARVAVVTGCLGGCLHHHLRTRRQSDTRALPAAVSGTTGAAGFPPRVRSRFASHGEGTRQYLAGAAGGFDDQPSAYRSQSLDRPPTTFFGGDTRRAGPDPGADRRRTLPAVSRAGRASRQASGVARPSRDPHFVAQLCPGAGWQGARHRCGLALPPRAARGGRGVRPLEGIARGIRSRISRTPQLPLCRQRRRVDLALAPALRAKSTTSESNWRSISA